MKWSLSRNKICITPVIVTNSDDYESVKPVAQKTVAVGEALMELI